MSEKNEPNPETQSSGTSEQKPRDKTKAAEAAGYLATKNAQKDK